MLDQWRKVVAKAGADEKFRQRLLADPAGVLKENGIAVPAGRTLKIVENTHKVVHLVLPAKSSGELDDAELEQVSGGIIAILIGAKPPRPTDITDGTSNTRK